MMKVLLILPCLILEISATREIDIHIRDCAGTAGASSLHTVLSRPGSPIRPRENLKCAVLCYMQKVDFMDEAANMDMAKIKARTSRSQMYIYEIIRRCNEEVTISSRPCDRAFYINQCIGMGIFDAQIMKGRIKLELE